MTTDVVVRISEQYVDRFHPWLLVSDQLRASGFNLTATTDVNAPLGDINVVDYRLLRASPRRLKQVIERNLIIYHKSDSAAVTPDPNARNVLNDSRVKAWLKDVLPRDSALHNKPAIGGRQHLIWLPLRDGSYEAPTPQSMTLTDEAVAKIGSFIPIYMFPRMDDFRTIPRKPPSQRPIDVFFAGAVKYEWEQVTEHRQRACAAILETGRSSAVFSGNLLKGRDYRRMLQLSRIMVSPYGNGGFSWKDFECMYAGVVVIKPDTSYSKTYGFDVFDGDKHVVTCRPDLSDLSEKIDYIMDQPDRFDELSERNNAEIEQARDLDVLARDLIALFTAGLE